MQYIILAVQTLWTRRRKKTRYIFWHRKNFHELFKKIYTISSLFIHCSLLNCGDGQNEINSTLFNSEHINWTTTVCSALFLVMCRYSLCSYGVPLPWSLTHARPLLCVKPRRKTSKSPFHSFTHPFKNACANIHRHWCSISQSIVCSCFICPSKEGIPWHFTYASSA